MLPIGVSEVAVVYVCANLLLVAAAALFAGIRALSGTLPRPFSYQHLLVIGRVLTITAPLLPLTALWHGGGDLSPLTAQVWSAPSMHAAAAEIPDSARLELGLDSKHASLPLNAVTGATLLFFLAGFFLTLLPLVSEVSAIFRTIRNAHVLRHIGRVTVLVSDTERVPFAAWIPGHSFIVLPAALLLRPADLRIALRHETQHHRQRDTRHLYALLLGRALFGLNPAMYWLTRQLFELQEFACDEALARREGHCARAYCACLLHVAETALPARHTQLRSFMASGYALALTRRIEAALRRPARSLPARTAAIVSLLAVALLTAVSTAVGTPVLDRRLSRAEAEQLVATTQKSTLFPLRVNDRVLTQLNLLLGTPDGRTFLSTSIARMRLYQPNIRSELMRHGLPAELLAVPLVESGYRNLHSSGAGAGLWMFIAPTARHYGLEVSAERDERLDIRAETRAAMRMFSDLQRRFHDWPLTLMAYNSGVKQVETGMTATRSRDAWTLYQAGYGNEPDYLARTVAAIVILANPQLLD